MSLNDDCIDILQLSIEEVLRGKGTKGVYFSSGIHPWDSAQPNAKQVINDLEQLANSDTFFCIGECGIDRACDVPLEIQFPVFEQQVQIAQKTGKPLIIHAVRSYSDILSVLKKYAVTIPIIFHDFRGNEVQITQMLHYNAYFSFGFSGISQAKMHKNIHLIPRERLCLETDDDNRQVSDMYGIASDILDISVSELCGYLVQNFKRIMQKDIL
ncbi:MAG: TatD family hydrolase [Bacteroidales bacterium]|jgi:TatD DNase family protein|nr:TatD family hydrolase [Bacteroidales bacterium]